MDPNETLKIIREAIEAENYAVASMHFIYLDEWLSKGGFLPDDWTQR